MIKDSDFRKAIELIDASTEVLLTAHIRPDGDACGSMRAMCEVLTARGKRAHPLFLSPLPPWYGFIFDEKVPVLGNDISKEELLAGHFNQCDLVIVMDTNSYVQLTHFDEWIKETGKTVLVFDHHLTGDGLGDFELIDSSAAATGEIVQDLLSFADWEITPKIAEALFVAMATDSGWFKFGNADSRIFRAAAQLIDAGAEPAVIYQKLYQDISPARMKLLIRMLTNMELHFDNRMAVQYILRSDFDETGATGQDTENLIDECQRIGSVEAAALMVELSDGGFRCSLRSKGKVDVRKIAQKYGGGGHMLASGVNLEGPLEKAKQTIIREVAKQLTD
ncbi:MAG: bifunctional oligoribonuclease/PAP phosphatase NrnA [Planctomycetes bacterium]|nr:bifunctional oligoribonuclease/PAP phosphatase NrnA [Planctomycetota bacterium]